MKIENLFDKFQFFISGAYGMVCSADLLESIKELIKSSKFPAVQNIKVYKILGFSSAFCEKYGIETLGDLSDTDFWDIDYDEAQNIHSTLSANLPYLITADEVKKVLLKGLSDRNKYVIENRLFEITATLTEIASKFNLTKQRILQMCQNYEQKVKNSNDVIVIASLFLTLKFICECEHCFTAEELANYGISERFLMSAAEMLDNTYLTHISNTDYTAFCTKGKTVQWLNIIEMELGLHKLLSLGEWNRIIRRLSRATKAAGYLIPESMIETIALRDYAKSKDYAYLKSLTLTDKYDFVLSKHFPNGMQIFKQDEVDAFRKGYESMFSDTRAPFIGAITEKIRNEGVLVDYGVYAMELKTELPEILIEQIKGFITQYPCDMVKTEAVLHKFREALNSVNVTNKHHLQSILEKHLPCFVYHNDYVFKGDKAGNHIAQFLETCPYGMALQKLASHLKKATPQSISFALLQDDNIISMSPNMYIHRNRIALQEQKQLFTFLKYIVPQDRFISDQHVFGLLRASFPQFLTQNSIRSPYYLFGVLRSFFKHEFNFSRPFIIDLACDCDSENYFNKEPLRKIFWGKNVASIRAIKQYANDMQVPFYDLSRLLNSFNDGYFIRDTEYIISIDEIGYTVKEFLQVEEIVANALGNQRYCEISKLPNIFSEMPKAKVCITDWIIYSILNRYGTQLSVISSNHVFNASVPLVYSNSVDVDTIRDDYAAMHPGSRAFR
jgi:hypothetical protein